MGGIAKIFGGGKTKIEVPDKSPEELALLNEQTTLLREQRDQLAKQLKEQDLLRPLLFSELGLEETRDALGNVTGYRKAALTESQQRQADIQKRLEERTVAALEGTLPVDPGLERELEQGRLDLAESLRKQIGPGWETSTPGIQALSEYDKRAKELRAGARTGQLTLSEQLAGARETRGSANKFQTINDIMGTSQGGLPFINSGINLSGAFSGPLSLMANERSLATNAAAQSANINAQTRGAMLGGFGQLAGAALFAPTTGNSLFSRIFR